MGGLAVGFRELSWYHRGNLYHTSDVLSPTMLEFLTLPVFHLGDTGSNPVGVTFSRKVAARRLFAVWGGAGVVCTQPLIA